tara:strand:+ start:133 stop:255 length:123 start_codon:yes stop_codon:yes gene_type:complete
VKEGYYYLKNQKIQHLLLSFHLLFGGKLVLLLKGKMMMLF